VLDVLEHLDDDTAGLREVARLIAPSGLLMVTVPAHSSCNVTWRRSGPVGLFEKDFAALIQFRKFELVEHQSIAFLFDASPSLVTAASTIQT
jgi:hypothetical protein